VTVTQAGTRLAAAARARAVTVLRYIRANVTVLKEREPTNLSGFPGGVTFWWLDFHAELSRRTGARRSRATVMIGHRLGGLRSLSGQEPSLLPFTVTKVRNLKGGGAGPGLSVMKLEINQCDLRGSLRARILK
jgi:hypothetical protein